MKVEVIPNRGPASMVAELETRMPAAKRIDIASAFVTPPALTRIENLLRRPGKKGPVPVVRMVFGVYQRFTPPGALAKMLRLQKRYPARFMARIAINQRFHWKLFILRQQAKGIYYVGSANLTEDGLAASGELSLKVTAVSSDRIAKSLKKEFEDLWREGSWALTRDLAQEYGKVKRPPVSFLKNKPDGMLSRILEKPARTASPARKRNGKVRLIYFDKFFDVKTISVLRQNTGWDLHTWDCGSFDTRKDFNPILAADTYLIVYNSPKRGDLCMKFARREESAELETKDGRYFISYSYLPGTRGRCYRAIAPALKAAGFTKADLRRDRFLSKREIDSLARILRVPRRML
jgi:HKD family nuclease